MDEKFNKKKMEILNIEKFVALACIWATERYAISTNRVQGFASIVSKYRHDITLFISCQHYAFIIS